MKYILSIYCFELFLLTIFSYLFIDPNLIYLHKLYSGFTFTNKEITTGIYVFFITSIFILYLYLVSAYKNEFAKMKKVIIASAVILLFSYPAMVSFDVFNYIATAKVIFHYKENPYVIMPIEFLNDPLLLFMHAPNKTALYGPLWILLTGSPYILGVGNFLLTLFLFKILIGIFYFTAINFFRKLSDNTSTLFFALNPLVVFETFVSGHNDIVMICFVLISYYLLKKQKPSVSILFFIASILIKYSTIFLIPAYIIALLKLIKGREINWQQLYFYSFLSMFFIFLLSPIREEMYPWYGLWFLPFSFLMIKQRAIRIFSISLSFALLLRYVPFMLTANYFGSTPIIRSFLTIIPPFVTMTIYILRNSLWIKKLRLL